MNVGVFEPDPDELDKIGGMYPDRHAAFVDRPVVNISDPDAGDAKPVLVGIERAECFAESLAEAIAGIRPHGDVDTDLLAAGIETHRVVCRGKDYALHACPVG